MRPRYTSTFLFSRICCSRKFQFDVPGKKSRKFWSCFYLIAALSVTGVGANGFVFDVLAHGRIDALVSGRIADLESWGIWKATWFPPWSWQGYSPTGLFFSCRPIWQSKQRAEGPPPSVCPRLRICLRKD